jgi:hypothetical protein
MNRRLCISGHGEGNQSLAFRKQVVTVENLVGVGINQAVKFQNMGLVKFQDNEELGQIQELLIV